MSGNVEVIEHLINKVNISTKNAFIQVPTKIELTFFLKNKLFILFVFAYLLFYLFYLIIFWEGGGSLNFNSFLAPSLLVTHNE